MSKGSPREVAVIWLVWAAIHSVLASSQAKRLTERVLGSRFRNGLYRPFFVLQSVLLLVLAALRYIRLPDRPLYDVPLPWSLLFRLGQAASLVMLWRSVRVVGIARMLGLPQLVALWRGELPQPEPEAQGPPLDASGQLKIAGPFRYTRHSDNLPIFGVLWLLPRMTVNRLTLTILSSIYAVVGSIHEEYRLRAAYGERYARYQRMVPFMLPRIQPVPQQPAAVDDSASLDGAGGDEGIAVG